MKKLLSFLLCIMFLLQLTPVFATEAETEASADAATTEALSPASTQQRRMWSSTSYKNWDWVYEPWSLNFWGRVNYVRFASDELQAATIKKATIKFDARARETEKTVYMAAIALSDVSGLKIETNLNSLTSTNKITATGSSTDRLMIDDTGYYLPEVSSSVVAYTKTTASDTVTTDNTYTSSSGIVFNYPLSIELDVTDSVVSAFEKGNHIQFVLIPAKDILTDDGDNLFDMEGFGSYSNGVIYDEYGNVLENTESTLKLDTSIPVCGNAGFYSSQDIDDIYFSWHHIIRDSIVLEIEYKTDEEIFMDFASNCQSAEELNNNIDTWKRLLDGDAFALYELIRDDSGINEALLAVLKKCESMADFQAAFIDAVETAYWQGYDYCTNLIINLEGKSGRISIDGENIPQTAYALIEVYNSDELLKKYTVDVKEGTGFYNARENDSTEIRITYTSDKEGLVPLSWTRTVDVTSAYIPEIFITELSNCHTRAYYANSSNGAPEEQPFQYIELYNYGNTAVDLSEYTFVYNDGTEHSFDWVLEESGSLIVNPGELYVIGVYSYWSAHLGYTYDSYWDGFNGFYEIDIPKTNRVMIACVESGKESAVIDDITQLKSTLDAGVTTRAELRKNGETVTRVSMPANLPQPDFAYQFGFSDGVEEKNLFCSGCFPYALLDEQRTDYSESVHYTTDDTIKAMSYNVLTQDNILGGSVKKRFNLLLATMEKFDLDIIGLQEISYEWHQLMKTDFLSNWEYVIGLTTSGYDYETTSIWNLMNPICYNTDRYTLIHSGEAFLTPDGEMETQQWDSNNMKRTMTWAVLQDKTTEDIISVVNTHLVLSGKQARVEQVKLIYQKAAELQETYGGAVITMGDHNMRENSEPYREYLKGGVVVDSKYQTINHRSVATAPTMGKYDENYGAPIDFCFVSPDELIVQKYDVFDGVYEKGVIVNGAWSSEGTLSDHSAVYIELLNRKNVIDVENSIISYDSETQTAFVGLDGAEEYSVIFADYEGGRLKKTNTVKYTSDGACNAYVKQTDTSFALDGDDKIFLWKSGMDEPLCVPFVVK